MKKKAATKKILSAEDTFLLLSSTLPLFMYLLRKTAKEHLTSLPEPYNHMALKYLKPKQAKKIHLVKSSALKAAFDFSKTEEGEEFWKAILDNIIHPDKPEPQYLLTSK